MPCELSAEFKSILLSREARLVQPEQPPGLDLGVGTSHPLLVPLPLSCHITFPSADYAASLSQPASPTGGELGSGGLYPALLLSYFSTAVHAQTPGKRWWVGEKWTMVCQLEYAVLNYRGNRSGSR